jgi:hypothetical protein
MPALTIEYRDKSHRIAQALAIAYVTQLRQIARDGPDSPVLEACEKLALKAAPKAGWRASSPTN